MRILQLPSAISRDLVVINIIVVLIIAVVAHALRHHTLPWLHGPTRHTHRAATACEPRGLTLTLSVKPK